jgi:hypothetical protein
MAHPVHKLTTKQKIDKLDARVGVLALDTLDAESAEGRRRAKKARKLQRAKKALEFHLQPHRPKD